MSAYTTKLSVSAKVSAYAKSLLGEGFTYQDGHKHYILLYKCTDEHEEKIKAIMDRVTHNQCKYDFIPVTDKEKEDIEARLSLKPQAKKSIGVDPNIIPFDLKRLDSNDFFKKIRMSDKQVDDMCAFLDHFESQGAISLTENINEPNPVPSKFGAYGTYDEVLFGKRVKITCQLIYVEKYKGYIVSFHRISFLDENGKWKDLPRQWLNIGPKQTFRNYFLSAARKASEKYERMFVLV